MSTYAMESFQFLIFNKKKKIKKKTFYLFKAV